MKICPFCAEEIQDEAILCRYCNQRLDELEDELDLEEEYEDEKKKLDWVQIVFISLIVVAIAAIAYVYIDRQTDRVRQDISDALTGNDSLYVTVVYEIRGTANSGTVTWMNDQGGTQQEEVRIPFSKTYQMQPGDIMSILVQNSEARGSVICRIKVNGVVVKEAESSGGYVIAMCWGIVGE